MVAPNSSEEVRYDILIEAKQAIESLKQLGLTTQDNTTKIQNFSNLVLSSSREWKVSWMQALEVYKLLNAELSKQKKGTIFGQTGGQDLFSKSSDYIKALEDGGRLTEEVAQKSAKLGNESKSAFERAITGVNGFRIALGAVISMLLFQGIQAVTQFFQTAMKNAQELEAALYRIHNAERILSGEGINVSTKGLEDGIKRIKALLPIFSKEDIAGLVGQVAITTKSLGLTEKQIVDLSQAIAILNVNSAEEETLQTTAQHVISSLLTSNAKGVANLGLKLGDAAIEAQAFSMGLLQAGESVKDLTDHEKSIVKVAIAIDGAGQSIAGLNEYMDTNTAKIQKNKAAWNDLLTTIGQAILPFVPAATALFDALTDSANYFKTALATVGTVLTTVLTVLRMLLGGNIKSFGELRQAIHDVGEEAKKLVFKQLFPEGVPDNAPEWFKRLAPDMSPSETPTAPGGVDNGDVQGEQKAQDDRVKAIADAQKKIQDALKDSADKKLDIERDYQRKLEDIATNYGQKLEDIARKTAEKQEDALRNYNQKVEDINRNADESIQKAKEESHKQEIDREAKFQQQLKELREKFLFSLEDALHERDARQVLRLIRQYNMDKQNLEDRHKLEQQQAKVDLTNKLKNIEMERQQKLEAARRDYEEKLKEIAIGEARERAEANLWRSRQLADARLWHQRQLEEQRQYLQRKLRDIADALKAEYNLTKAGAQAITGLMSSTLSALSSLYAQFASGVMTPVTSGGAVVGGSYSTPGAGWDALAQTFVNAGLYGTGMAEGGTMLATRPTKMTVGEKGAEAVTVTPLDRIGNNVGKTFGDRSAAGGMGGSVKISLELSPDLEARIIDNSLEGLAVQLEQIVRSK